MKYCGQLRKKKAGLKKQYLVGTWLAGIFNLRAKIFSKERAGAEQLCITNRGCCFYLQSAEDDSN